VGCGCRGRELARALVADGHAVRGTTRDPARLDDIDAAGAEPALADPDRLATLLPAIEGVSGICWLMGTATGEADSVAALHGPRLSSLLERLVDTPVRGFVYEAAGSAGASILGGGAGVVRSAADTFRMPVEIVHADPNAFDDWTSAMAAAVRGVLAGRSP
jgi:NAD(P)-dependent dehydrogenase (short-subunit alcohol dehydrogenase family)